MRVVYLFWNKENKNTHTRVEQLFFYSNKSTRHDVTEILQLGLKSGTKGVELESRGQPVRMAWSTVHLG